MIFEDQLAALESDSKQASARRASEIDFALLVDGLAAEREQGITIDVAYRFFSTEKRKFIVADTPGHEQYTRNMVTGASTADLAVILIDARKGVLTQTRRHSYLVSLLGIRHVVLAVNKMDLVDYDQDVFDAIEADYRAFADQIGIDDVAVHPDVGAEGRQRHRAAAQRRPGTTGPTPARAPRDGRASTTTAAPTGRSACRCSGSTGRTSTSAASPGRSSAARCGRATRCACCRPAATSTVDADRHARRRSRRGRRRPVGDAHPGRRDRRQPRRRASPRPTTRPRSPTSSRRRSSGCDDEPCCPGRAYLLKLGTQTGRRHGRRAQVQDQRQHARAPRGARRWS